MLHGCFPGHGTALRYGSPVRARAALVLATLFWAGNYLVGHLAVESLSPASLTFLRWALALVPLLLVAQFTEHPDWRAAARQWPRLTVLSLLGVAGYNLLLYTALQHTTALSASLINAANPAVLALLAAAVLRERIGWRGAAGLVLGLLGVLLVLTDGALLSVFRLHYNVGDLLMLGAIVVWSLYTILGRGVTGVPPFTSIALQALITVVLLAPVCLATGLTLPGDAATGWALAFIALFPSVGSYVLWNVGVRRVPASQAGLYLNLITVFTAIVSVLLGGAMTAAQVVGGLLVFAGVGLSSLSSRSPHPGGTHPSLRDSDIPPAARDGSRREG